VEQLMHKAFEYEVKFGKDGRPVERRLSVGPVLVTAVSGVVLALTDDTLWGGVLKVLETIKWW
jgi:hypothetical protein